jgi:hypothetical protein
MASDQEIQAFFGVRVQRVAELQARYRAGWPASLGGCGVGCLVPLALLFVFMGFRDRWADHPQYMTTVVAAWVVALVSAGLGYRIHAHGQKLFEPVDAAVDAELIQPFAALLVDGATLAHPDDSILEWRASLLFTREAYIYATNGQTTRITGRIDGLPLELDEMFIRYRPNKDATFSGWVVRVGLPFAVGGHLRIRETKWGFDSLLWREGFEPLADATARLGNGLAVEAAAPGVTPEGANAPTSAGVPAEALLTDALFELLRGAGKVQLAATGSTLWVVVPNVRAFDNRRNAAGFDADYGRKTAQRIALVESLVREVVRAGTGG